MPGPGRPHRPPRCADSFAGWHRLPTVGIARGRAAGRLRSLGGGGSTGGAQAGNRSETCSRIADVEERARRIVETAVELAEQGGFEAVRLRDVAAHAGVALGTLYRRFSSKEDLLLAALEQELEDVKQRFEKKPPEGDTPLERVTSFFHVTTRALCRRPNLARALIRSIATGEPELTQKVAAFHKLTESLITMALRGESAAHLVEPSEPERRIGNVLQQVWFASLIGWGAGLHGQGAIVDQTREAAELLIAGAGL